MWQLVEVDGGGGKVDGGGGKVDNSKSQQDNDSPQTNHLGTILAIVFAGVAIVACIVGYVMVQKVKAEKQAVPPTSFSNPGYDQAPATVRLNPFATHAVHVLGRFGSSVTPDLTARCGLALRSVRVC